MPEIGDLKPSRTPAGFVTNWSASAELIRLSLPDECNQLSKSPLPIIDHPARYLDVWWI